ncbi:tRNA nucleotidyltransferase [Alishewanella phage vB_AspM_Slicko01]|nr:tRNA nucleotidyltransferase [Alishewanella phage vB_AspM_Slicko01]
MKVYLVGGAVRDSLLGLTPKDKDYVVVGSSPDEMLALGYTQVGKDFPVFIHPDTGCEYALSRTERKIDTGYHGFAVDWSEVTLEQDLSRRDLTINAMAIDLDDGSVIDYFGGQADLHNKILRPTSNAFIEDPIRVLRVGRFLARYPDFYPADELITFSRLAAKEISNCAPERIWKEIEKALSEYRPSRFMFWMQRFGTFEMLTKMSYTPQVPTHHPEIWVDVHTGMVMDYAATVYKDVEITFACFMHDFGKPECHVLYKNAHGHEQVGLHFINEFCDRWKVPNSYRNLALLTCEFHTKIHGCMGRGANEWTRPKTIMKMFEAIGALKQPERFVKILHACEADARGRGKGKEQIEEYRSKPYPQKEYLTECLDAVLTFDTKTITIPLLESGTDGKKIGEIVRMHRIVEITKVQKKWRKL